eukprot:CAMPEP_0204583380 /NCGR_PEP_ID=MMETSP0661-20131031/45744_1 /ASSEMBLY_ACC=CAM_ASM_000606 /TAXON_ID=109239 /ORGANISM="Alexandrium margalefi, Strain AMGDE01CS-322" /LENGTH=98 /DNA_ID=CAMNT_0051592729 /DNA_START=185 /DNA_END=481 /DNA_ORIENTATION=+
MQVTLGIVLHPVCGIIQLDEATILLDLFIQAAQLFCAVLDTPHAFAHVPVTQHGLQDEPIHEVLGLVVAVPTAMGGVAAKDATPQHALAGSQGPAIAL